MIKLEKQFIDIAGGERIAYIEQGWGDVLMLLHGNMSSGVHYAPLFERIDGFRMIAPDLRGFGDSGYSRPFSSLRELAEDVKLFMDALKIEKAHIVGWSTGGGVALELAAAYPGKARSLFSIEGAGHKGYPLFYKNADLTSTDRPYESKEALAADPVVVAPCLAATAALNAAFYEYVWNASIYPVNKPSAEDNAVYLSETLKQRNLVDLDWSLANFNMSDGANAYGKGTGAIRKVVCPTAFTSGVFDYVVPRAMVDENVNAIPGAKLIVYENCGHSPLVDCPDRLAADIKEFLSK